MVWVWKVVENINDGFCYDLGLGPCVGFSSCGVDLDQMPFFTKQSLSPYKTNRKKEKEKKYFFRSDCFSKFQEKISSRSKAMRQPHSLAS